MLLLNVLNFGILIFSLLAVLVPNPIYSVIFLIFSLFSSAAVLLLLNVEFLAFIILIVYVGAIAILFLFVIMMLNLTSYKGLRVNWFNFFAISSFMSIFYFFLTRFVHKYFSPTNFEYRYQNWLDSVDNYSNIQVIGYVLYTDFFTLFLSSSLVLLVAMVGAIVITSGRVSRGRKQLIHYQLSQTYKTSIKFRI